MSSKYDIMIDIETLATTSDCVILSFGYQKFNDKGLLDGAEIALPTKEQIKQGRRVMLSTIQWWSKQSELARATLDRSCELDARSHDFTFDAPLINRLSLIYNTLLDTGNVRYYWYKGFDLDCIYHLLVSNGYDVSKIPFYKGMDFRTIENLVKHTKVYQDFKKGIPTEHTALGDCKNQIKQLLKAKELITIATG